MSPASVDAPGPGGRDALDPADLQAVRAQLGRSPRGVTGVAHRCPCGLPDAVVTAPRLPDGTPFPTLYYLTCPRVVSAVGTLESAGTMRDMTQRLAAELELATAYRAAHERYLADRARLGEVPEIDGVSAGGMPDRVKCLHVLLAHALAAGPGVNPLGDATRDLLEPWWTAGPCVAVDGPDEVAP
jgi:uncharacterized protein